jgi:hypothetical protein
MIALLALKAVSNATGDVRIAANALTGEKTAPGIKPP